MLFHALNSRLVLLGVALMISGCQNALVDVDPASEGFYSREQARPDLSVWSVSELSAKRSAPVAQNATYSVYVWSSAFRAQSNGALLSLLQEHGIGEVLLSIGPNDELKSKAARFINQAHRKKIKVHLLLGSNSVINPDKFDRFDRLNDDALALKADGVHLDVEPHTLGDWYDNRERYLEMYVTMVQEARRRIDPRLGLGVSIIRHYGESIIRQLLPECDDVTLMTYSETDAPDMVEKLGPYVPLDPDKIRLAIRPEDFLSMSEVYDFMETLKQGGTVTRFVMHDLEGIVSFQ